MEIDPRAFVEQQTRPGQPTMSKGFVTPRAQQVPQAQQGQAFVGGNTSQQTQNIAQDKFQQALDMANQGGYGGLAGGIAALFLGPKAAKLQEEVNKTQVKAENLKLEQGLLANSQAKNEIKIQEKKIEEINGMEALARLEANASENPQEDVKLAGGEMNENGSVKTNWQKTMELQKSGQIPGDLNLEEIAKFAPGIIPRMGQKHSKFTSESVIKELNEAGKQYRAYQDSMMDLQKATIKAKAAGGDDQTHRKNFEAYGKVTGSMGRIMEQLLDPMNMINEEAVNEIMTSVVMPGLRAAQKFGVNAGITNDKNTVTPGQAVDAVTTFKQTGDPTKVKEIQVKIGAANARAATLMNKPANSPDAVKTQKAPPLVSTPGAVPSKKEAKESVDPRLKGLGMKID